jgi:dihydrofolate synthase/folylpolyglutamate synthase
MSNNENIENSVVGGSSPLSRTTRFDRQLMNYTEAIQFLYQLRLFGLKFGLEKTRHLAALAGQPQDKLRFIHVAGTNGKGSTCAMLESIYRAAGLRVGLFTSPHLVSFAERIQVNRKWVAPEDVARLVEEMRGAAVFSGGGEGCPTFFEVVTVLALKYFAEQQCDLVVWETGLGGRLDATNIVTPLASVITNVQLDHQQWLGNTLPEIAREKAGIIKDNVPIITGAEDAEVLQVIAETARKHHAPLSVVTSSDAQAMDRHEIALAGEHQRMNAAVALRTTQILDGQIPISEAALRRGLKETQWAGRCQIIQRDNGQTVLLDGAHNPAAAQTLAGAWQRRFAGKKGALILGIMRDKDGGAVCQILAPLARRILLAPVGSERSADPRLLSDHCRRANPAAEITVCPNLAEAFANAGAEPFVVVTGSLYFVGEALEWLGLAPASGERALNEYGLAPAGTVNEPAVSSF